MKKLIGILFALALILAVFIGLNLSKIQRLHRVNTLFDADKIVHNFSNMDDALFSHTLQATGTPHIWPEATQDLPDAVEIDGDVRDLSEFLEETATTALLVVKDGTILHENYFLGTSRDDQRISWSMAKSFLSALFGVVLEDGRVESLDDPVAKYVPELKGTAYDGATIRNVLNMASGVAFNEDYLERNSDINKMGRVLALGGSMDEFTTDLKQTARTPGSARQYVSIDTHVIGMVLRKVSGKSNHDFFIDNLWSKIGAGKDAFYSTDGEGVAFVLGGLNMRTRDYALFGQLFLQGGDWKGEQIIPASWVANSTTNSAPSDSSTENSGVGYGYQWWVPLDSVHNGGDYFAVGIYEQYIYINPAAKIVIVKNSANRQFKEMGQSGKSYKLESIDMFRSLTNYYVNQE